MKPRISVSKRILNELDHQVNAASKAGDLTRFKKAKAISLVVAGYTYHAAANVLEITADSVSTWVNRFMTDRWDIFVSGKSPGRPPKLTKSQKCRLTRAIKLGPAGNGYPGACWRSPMVQDFIRKTFGVFYSVFYIAELLKNLGFTYQKARFAADHLDEAARRQWLVDTWPRILSLGRRRQAYILFGDEASFPQWGSLSYTWSPRGEQPVVRTSGKRKGYKVFGLVEYFSGKFFTKALEERLTSVTYGEFLTEVMAKTRKHLIIIQDGARYHTSRAMREFFCHHKDRLTVFQLPSYSPDFNPIEKLWKKIKERGVHMQYFPTFEALKNKVEEMLLHFADARSEILVLFGFYRNIKVQT